jgi:hypothetical protein
MFDREGELVLQLAQAGKVIYTVAFTVAPRDGRPALSASAASRAARPRMRAKRSASPPATCTACVRSS